MVHLVPQLKCIDSKQITPSERITSQQNHNQNLKDLEQFIQNENEENKMGKSSSS